MGAQPSTIKSGGTLRGSFAPPLRTDLNVPNLAGPKTYKLIVSKGKKGGDNATYTIAGRSVSVKIPPTLSSGSQFEYEDEGDVNLVIASTLPTVPGMEIIQAKPIVWGSVSRAYYDRQDVKGSQVRSVNLLCVSRREWRMLTTTEFYAAISGSGSRFTNARSANQASSTSD
jgi:hypothetical protein